MIYMNKSLSSSSQLGLCLGHSNLKHEHGAVAEWALAPALPLAWRRDQTRGQHGTVRVQLMVCQFQVQVVNMYMSDSNIP